MALLQYYFSSRSNFIADPIRTNPHSSASITPHCTEFSAFSINP